MRARDGRLAGEKGARPESVVDMAVSRCVGASGGRVKVKGVLSSDVSVRSEG